MCVCACLCTSVYMAQAYTHNVYMCVCMHVCMNAAARMCGRVCVYECACVTFVNFNSLCRWMSEEYFTHFNLALNVFTGVILQ